MGPAYKAGLIAGAKLVAVNGLAFDADRLKAAVTAAKGGGPAVELIVQDGERFRTLRIPYDGGLRYPRLERIPGTPDRLGEILTARTR
jgi:predicted metalloprotease with PDZ domain